MSASAAARLLREHIHTALYHPRTGYFASRVVVASPPPLVFSSLRGKSGYTRALAASYAASECGWLTPAEIFAPFYSYGVAAYILATHAAACAAAASSHARLPPPLLHVFEVGGGNGTHARHVCDYIRTTAPRVYAQGLRYTILEISQALVEKQSATLAAHGHERAARSILADAMGDLRGALADDAPSTSTQGAPPSCFVVALEVLDNLPHDKVVSLHGVLHEACVEPACGHGSVAGGDGSSGTPLQETYRPLQDPLIRDAFTLQVAQEEKDVEGSSAGVVGALLRGRAALAAVSRAVVPQLPARAWQGAAAGLPPQPAGFDWAMHVPTGSLSLLRSLHAALPTARLVLADFSHLPAPHAGRVSAAAPLMTPPHSYAPADPPYACGGPFPLAPLRGLHGRLGWSLLTRGSHRFGSVLCASKAGGEQSIDHATPLSPVPARGEADIFFPTDFPLLARLVAHASGRPLAPIVIGGGADPEPRGRLRVVHSRAFLARHADTQRTVTQTGYNPLLEDFVNTRFLLS